MTFFRELPVAVLAAAMAITLSACTININSGNPAATEATPMDEEKAQVLACKVYYDHYLVPLRTTGDTVPTLDIAAEFVNHQNDAITELSNLPGEVAGVLLAFHTDQLSYWQWHHDALASREGLDGIESLRRWSLIMDLPATTRDVCWQFIE
jgi:hypothetical protein